MFQATLKFISNEFNMSHESIIIEFTYRIRASVGEGDNAEEKGKLESHC
jgi:hypothetical protein